MKQLHSLLKRQLKRHFGSTDSIPEKLHSFIDVVNDAYWQADDDRSMLERSLDLSSQELLQANSEMRAVFQALPDLFFRLDSEGTILDYKAGSVADLYIPPEKFLGKRIQDIPLGEVGKKYQKAIVQVQKTKSLINLEYSLKFQNKKEYYEARLLPLLENQIIVIIRNITERKQIEAAIESSYQLQEVMNSLLRISLENVPLKEILEKALDKIIAAPFMPKMPKGGIFLVGKTPNMLILKAHIGFSESTQARCAQVPFGFCLCGLAADSGQIQFADNVDNRHVYTYNGIAPHGHYNIPIISKEKVLGVIVLYLEEGHIHNEKDEEFLRAVADTMAGIIERKQAEASVKESETRLRAVIEATPDSIFFKDPKGRWLLVNQASIKIFEMEGQDYYGKTDRELGEFNPFFKDALDYCYHTDKNAWEIGKLSKSEEIIPQKSGEPRILDVVKVPLFNEDGSRNGLVVIGRDITERKLSEEEILYRARKQALVAELGQQALAGADLSPLMDKATALAAKILKVEYCKILELLPDKNTLLLKAGVGWTKGLVGHATVGTGSNSQAGYTLSSKEPVIVKDLRTEKRFSGPSFLLDHNVISGISVIIEGKEQPFGVMGAHTTKQKIFTQDDAHFLQSIAHVLAEAIERKRAEEQIIASLREKEVLIKEIHHRVKNNLQVISSLLNLQSSYIQDKTGRNFFKETQHRIRSMALIHEKLYQSDDLAKIDFGDYVRSLTTIIFHSFMEKDAMYKLILDIQNIYIDINIAVPCGLIINELVYNSLIHAFPRGHRGGKVSISFQRDKKNRFILIVSDNGVGFSKGVDFQNTDSLGLQLVITLVEQLEGTIELDQKAGTKFKIIFQETS